MTMRLRDLAGFALILSAPMAHAGELPDPRQKCLPGEYEGNEPEIAAGLALSEDGRFRYAMSYGALDEGAVGTWRADAGSVYLTSGPVSLPRFSVASDDANPEKVLRISLKLPGDLSTQYFAAVINFADGRRIGRQFTDEEVVLPIAAGERPVSVTLLLPVFDLASEPLAIAAGEGRDVVVRFDPNDLGAVAFAETPVARDGDVLKLTRHGRELQFRQVSGPCIGKVKN